MANEFEVTWAYRSMTARYDGVKTVRSNYSDIDTVKQRAKREIANDLCTSAGMVEIVEIKQIFK